MSGNLNIMEITYRNATSINCDAFSVVIVYEVGKFVRVSQMKTVNTFFMKINILFVFIYICWRFSRIPSEKTPLIIRSLPAIVLIGTTRRWR